MKQKKLSSSFLPSFKILILIFFVFSLIVFFSVWYFSNALMDNFIEEISKQKNYSFFVENEGLRQIALLDYNKILIDFELFLRKTLAFIGFFSLLFFAILFLSFSFILKLGAYLERLSFIAFADKLIYGMNEIKKTDFSFRMQEEDIFRGSVVFKTIGKSFNVMAEALESADRAKKALLDVQIKNNTLWLESFKRRQKDLAIHKARLEKRVKSRTGLLEAINAALRSALRSLERRTSEISCLNSLAESLQEVKKMDKACTMVIKSCKQIFPSDSGSLIFFDDKGKVKYMDGWGQRLGDFDFIHNCKEEEGGKGVLFYPDKIISSKDCEDICVPLSFMGGGKMVLYIYLSDMADLQGRRQAARRALLGNIMGHLRASLTNIHLLERLRHEAITDPLTGLYNRRYMEEAFKRDFYRLLREKKPVSIILMDIDDFKLLNDNYGHDKGDMVLKKLAEVLKEDVRSEDMICRFGGEEFLLYMPGMALDIAVARAELMRKKVEETRIYLDSEDKQDIKITLSLGVSAFPEDADNPSDLITKADKAMYAAKRTGKNKVLSLKSIEL